MALASMARNSTTTLMIYMGDTVVDMHSGGKGRRYCILVGSTRHEIGPGKGTAFWRTGNHFDRLVAKKS